MRGKLGVHSELHRVRMCLFTLYCFPSTQFGGRGELGDRRGLPTEVQKGNLIPMWSMAIERLSFFSHLFSIQVKFHNQKQEKKIFV